MKKYFLKVAILALVFPILANANARVVKCDESKIAPIYLRPTFGTAINFPIKPDDVVFGSTKLFDVKYIKNDIVLTALTANASTNMFVYLFGRRCSFLITANSGRYDNVIRVQDPDENKLKVKINE